MAKHIIFFRNCLLLSLLYIIAACTKLDTEAPKLELLPDADGLNFRGTTYVDPGYIVFDNHTCNSEDIVTVANSVDENRYGTYTIVYTAVDNQGNSSSIARKVDIVLPVNDFYHQEWEAYDTCTSGNYNYTGLIQDCDCEGNYVTVGNISNFGLNAAFKLPISGNYAEWLSLDTTKAAITFLGTGMMAPGADSLYWSYSISDSVSTDVCTSIWIK